MATIEVVLQDIMNEVVEQLENDPILRTQVNEMLAETFDPYVPYITGRLANNISIDADGITYEQPYAEDVYDSPFGHYLGFHPLATSYWDEVAMANHKDEIEAKATELVEQRLKEMDING